MSVSCVLNSLAANLNITKVSQLQNGSEEPDAQTISSTSGLAMDSSNTKFYDDKDVQMVTRNMNIVSIDEDVISALDSQKNVQDIIDFLSRPITVLSGQFNTTDTFSVLNLNAVPGILFTGEGDMWKQKLRGIYGIRFTMTFKIVVNGQKFQQGRYCMGFVPSCGAQDSSSLRNALLTANLHMSTLTQRTTIPHVEVDINAGTSAELTIPFMSVYNFLPSYNWVSGDNSLGYLSIYPYYHLENVVAGPIGYTVYCRLSDVKLFGATSPQSGLTKFKGYQDKEVSNKMNGPISAPLTHVSKAVAELGKIPLLTDFALPVSWIADRLAKTAKIFGFSKPVQGDSLVKFTPLTASNHTTVDGDSDARSLSYLSKPSVSILNGLSGTNKDEMDFSYICGKYAYFKMFDWSTSLTVGSYPTNSTTYVTPATSCDRTPSSTSINYTPVGFVSSFFVYFRGSITYRIKIVKTEYHSGRIAVFWDPAVTVPAPQYLNRMIIDIRETNEFEITIPYFNEAPYLPLTTQNGRLLFQVVDPLVAPATVPDTIHFLMEVKGGADLEFAVPRTDTEYIVTTVVPNSGLDSHELLNTDIGNTRVVGNDVLFSSVSMGDKVSSFRSYLKRYHAMIPAAPATVATPILNGTSLNVVTDCIPITINSANPAVLDNKWNTDLVGRVAACYGMWSGGIRLRNDISTNMGADSLSNASSCIVNTSSVSPNGTLLMTNATTAALAPNCHKVIQRLSMNNVVSVEIPQYTSSFARCVSDLYLDQSTTPSSWLSYSPTSLARTSVTVSFNVPKAAAPSPQNGYYFHNLSRALADDANFSVFISVPPLLAYTPTQLGQRY